MKPPEDFKKIMPEHLYPVTDIDVRTLAEIYEEEDVYLSLYLPTTRKEEDFNSTYISSRKRDINKAIDGDLEKEFERNMEMAEEEISKASIKGERGRVIFVSASQDLLHVYRIGVEPERSMVLDTSPFLLPLAKLRDDYEDYAILLMDSQEAKLFTVRSGSMEMEESSSIDLMNRHKKGGMSQMRFNRLRRGAIGSFIKEVMEDLEALEGMDDIRGILIAGPGEAKKQLVDELPQQLADMVISVEDISMDVSPGELLELGEEAAEKNEREKEKVMVSMLKKAIMKNMPSAYGAFKIKKALQEGRINVLILTKDASIPGWNCERCQLIQERTKMPQVCPNCGGKPSEVDVVEELYELAERTSADVEFVEDSDFLRSIGGMGALLRY